MDSLESSRTTFRSMIRDTMESSRTTFRSMIRGWLLTVGSRVSDSNLMNLQRVLSYLELGRWCSHQPGERRVQSLPSDKDVFALALAHVRGSRPLYLEFGVYEGASMRWWSEHLTTPGARFIGFDSFEGLREAFRELDAGHFATGGPPTFDDPRVSFVQGWFDVTLPSFEPPEHDQLIINIDCDLYSSTATVLQRIEAWLVPGSLLYFDELTDRDHEMRALFEFVARTGARLRPLGWSQGLHWLFLVEGP
jgi:Macrocin-O-methyltransferase (TylF)